MTMETKFSQICDLLNIKLGNLPDINCEFIKKIEVSENSTDFYYLYNFKNKRHPIFNKLEFIHSKTVSNIDKLKDYDSKLFIFSGTISNFNTILNIVDELYAILGSDDLERKECSSNDKLTMQKYSIVGRRWTNKTKDKLNLLFSVNEGKYTMKLTKF